MLKVAVTGRPSTGKSSVCRLFQELGAVSADADQIGHDLLETKLKKEVIDLFGPGITHLGAIDRSKLAKEVFTNKAKLRALEAITHPAIHHEIQKLINNISFETRAKVFVIEIPLLFEAGWENDFDATVLVTATHESCMNRTKWLDYQARQERFLPDQLVREKADYVIENNGTPEDLGLSVANIYQKLVNGLQRHN